MNVLDIPMQQNDAEAETVRDYLKALLFAVWSEGEGFSGKRPFGNSGWKHELFLALVKGGAIKGKLDDEGFLDEFDSKGGQEMIRQAIESLS